MIYKEYESQFGSYIGECDMCGETIIECDFDDVVCEMKAQGWKMEKVNDEWRHYCPSCRAKLRPTAQSDFAGIGGQ